MKATITLSNQLRPIVTDVEPGMPFVLDHSPDVVLTRANRIAEARGAGDFHAIAGFGIAGAGAPVVAVVIAVPEDRTIRAGTILHLSSQERVIPLRQVEPAAFVEAETTRG
ncbi:MAG: hypothetical protein HYV17_07885 [Xanthomonadales bacterium]|nr:hypothetical protein [Xanthomonadales bacterium]